MKKELVVLFALIVSCNGMEDIPKNKSAAESCAICLVKKPKSFPKKYITCKYDSAEGQVNHAFCSSCLLEGLKHQNYSCPLCMKRLSMGQRWAINISSHLATKKKKNYKEDLQYVLESGSTVLDDHWEHFEKELSFIHFKISALEHQVSKLLTEKQQLMWQLLHLVNAKKTEKKKDFQKKDFLIEFIFAGLLCLVSKNYFSKLFADIKFVKGIT